MTSSIGGAKAALRAVGNAILPGFTAPKILWMKKQEPKNYARLATVLLPHDYLNFWLTGRAFMTTVETHWWRGPAYYEVPWRGRWASR